MKTTSENLKIYFFIALSFLSSCNFLPTDDNQKLNQALKQKQKELELVERELELCKKENSENYNRVGSSDIPNSLSDVYETVKSSVFLIYTSDDITVSQGSAFNINPNGIAVSNYHVFGNASKAIAINDQGTKYIITEILDYDEDQDYIIFRLGPNEGNMPYLKIAPDLPRIGDPCYTVGNPLGLAWTLSQGIVSNYPQDVEDLIQISTEITNGSSGGPLVNSKGEVIGITTLTFGEANLNFAVKISKIPLEKYSSNFSFAKNDNQIDEKKIYNVIVAYYKARKNKEFDKMYNLYADKLDRYHSLFNISKNEALHDDQTKYFANYTIITSDIRSNTFEVKRIESFFIAQFELDLKIIRIKDEKQLIYVLNAIIEVDENLKIKSIYEDILK